MANNYGSNRDNKVMADSTVIQPSADEGPSPFVQQGMSQKKFVSAQVQFLDYREHTFHVHRKANGLILIDMVAAFLDLKEKDYFGLAYLDEQKTEHWLYPDKRISKQLKGVPLEFSFQVKFYPPQPTQLSEDLTRYLLYLQLRRDVYTERLPVSFAAQAHLGSLVAQAVLGDYQPTGDYADHLSNARIAQPTSEQEQFINYLRELHKQHRGMTAQEAELAYLNECKGLAMYGVHLFHGKDNKNKPTQVGVSSHGISVYSEQMRVHRFAWPGIIKFSFRRHNFSVKVKPGEIDSKKEASVSYHMGDYKHAKLLWKCAVEHHGFFRLIQPEPRHKHSLLSFGSTRFRYTGRTNIQSQMVSQLFDTNAPMAERAKSKSADMIAQKGHKEHSSPLNYADETTPEKPDKKGRPIDVHFVEQTDGKKKKKEKFTKKKADKKQKKRTTANGQKSTSASSSSSSSSSSDAEAEEIHVIVHDNKQKTAEQLLENSPEQLLKKAPELNATPVQTADTSTLPRTTVQTWHEESHGPEQVTTEVDEEGNVIRRIVKTDHIKHTVHTQSYQTVPVTADVTNSAAGISLQQVHTVQTNGIPNGDDATPGELVSTKVVTTGNRTIETLTYKTEKDGVVETRVEHRITIHANDEIDHEAELSRAILEATSMNPDMKVEKVEIERGKN